MTTSHPAEASHPAKWWHALPDGRIQCDLCPRDCRLREGQRGFCFVRAREADAMVLTTYGRSSGFCVDPIEKKPLNHFLPGSSVLSFGTAGCNLGCRFCQNWDISTSREMDRLMDRASPEAIAAAALSCGSESVAFTYNDPVIFAEYAIDTAVACHEVGVRAVAVTAGYIHDQPRRELFSVMDAVNVDLKGFTDDFYIRLTGARLHPVLDTLTHLVHETGAWVEITTLVIPGKNDSREELTAMCRWVVRELGPDVPMHFTAFHPAHRMSEVRATPLESLINAREVALAQGVRYAYTGNVRSRAGDTTFCPGCHARVIKRDGYAILGYRLTPDGHCQACGTGIPGRFAERAGTFGSRRFGINIR